MRTSALGHIQSNHDAHCLDFSTLLHPLDQGCLVASSDGVHAAPRGMRGGPAQNLFLRLRQRETIAAKPCTEVRNRMTLLVL